MSEVGRRGFLTGTMAAAGGIALGAVAGDAARTRETFHGAHQAGILSAPRPAAALLSFDLATRDRGELAALLKTLTGRARFLTAGGTAPNPGIASPPDDSGILGPTVRGGDLAVTVSLGSSAFDGRFGLAARKPAQLRAMDEFPNDDLDRSQCDGDLLVQIAADEPDTVVHAIRDVTRHSAGLLVPRWRIDGTSPPPRPSGGPRNYLGFKDGTANPDAGDHALMDQLVWVTGAAEPAWAAGGSYQVVRVIRMLTEFWDRVSISEQERMIGRRRDSGAPFTGRVEHDIPDYTNDPGGDATPLDAHIRLANPRTKATDGQRILRRSFNYDRGIDRNGSLDMGLVFTSYQRDLDRQFVTIQKRLAHEPLVDYISPVGGGYFFALPGLHDDRDWYGRALLS
ncbi:MAG: Dyp-type peroxidase [Actinomycetota bacterium]